VTRYLISFDDGTMTIPEEDLDDVGKAAHEVVEEAQRAGVWITGAGVQSQRASVVTTDGPSVTAPTQSQKRFWAVSPSSTCPHVRKRWSGLPSSRSRAAAHKRYENSCTIRPSDSEFPPRGRASLVNCTHQ